MRHTCGSTASQNCAPLKINNVTNLSTQPTIRHSVLTDAVVESATFCGNNSAVSSATCEPSSSDCTCPVRDGAPEDNWARSGKEAQNKCNRTLSIGSRHCQDAVVQPQTPHSWPDPQLSTTRDVEQSLLEIRERRTQLRPHLRPLLFRQNLQRCDFSAHRTAQSSKCNKNRAIMCVRSNTCTTTRAYLTEIDFILHQDVQLIGVKAHGKNTRSSTFLSFGHGDLHEWRQLNYDNKTESHDQM